MSGGPPTQGRFRALLLDQLADERVTKNSLEQRGIAVIASAGALVAITLGFVMLTTGQEAPASDVTVTSLHASALIALVAASVAGLCVNLPARIAKVAAEDLVNMAVGASWDAHDAESSREEFRILADMLSGLRSVNRRRARTLLAALLAEVLALACMSAATILPLLTGR